MVCTPQVSAKFGTGVTSLLDAVVIQVPRCGIGDVSECGGVCGIEGVYV